MPRKISKWSLLLATGLLACAPTQPTTRAKGEVRTMEVKTLERSFFQRLFGIPATPEPGNRACWTYGDGRIFIDLSRAPELAEPGGALRLEGDSLPRRLLVVRDEQGAFHAFHNKCTHFGRRLDPVPGTQTVQCCSMGKSTFDYQGERLHGAAREGIDTFPVQLEEGRLAITLPAGK